MRGCDSTEELEEEVTQYYSSLFTTSSPQADSQQATFMKSMLEEYSRCSGQLVNLKKLAIFFSNSTSPSTKDDICQMLEGVKERGIVKYLGMPFVIGRSKKEVFGYVVDVVQKRIRS